MLGTVKSSGKVSINPKSTAREICPATSKPRKRQEKFAYQPASAQSQGPQGMPPRQAIVQSTKPQLAPAANERWRNKRRRSSGCLSPQPIIVFKRLFPSPDIWRCHRKEIWITPVYIRHPLKYRTLQRSLLAEKLKSHSLAQGHITLKHHRNHPYESN